MLRRKQPLRRCSRRTRQRGALIACWQQGRAPKTLPRGALSRRASGLKRVCHPGSAVNAV